MLCLVVFLVSGLRATGFEGPVTENGSAETVVADDAAEGVANLQTEAVTTGTQQVAKQDGFDQSRSRRSSGTRAG